MLSLHIGEPIRLARLPRSNPRTRPQTQLAGSIQNASADTRSVDPEGRGPLPQSVSELPGKTHQVAAVDPPDDPDDPADRQTKDRRIRAEPRDVQPVASVARQLKLPAARRLNPAALDDFFLKANVAEPALVPRSKTATGNDARAASITSREIHRASVSFHVNVST